MIEVVGSGVRTPGVALVPRAAVVADAVGRGVQGGAERVAALGQDPRHDFSTLCALRARRRAGNEQNQESVVLAAPDGATTATNADLSDAG